MHHDTGTTNAATQSPTDVPQATVISCAADLDISGARDLYSRLQSALAARQPVVLDATQVERVDTAGLQILCAFVRDAVASGMAVQWQQPSLALRNAARLLNVSACLTLPAE